MDNSRKSLITTIIIIMLGFFTLGLSDLVWVYIISDKVDTKRFLPMKQIALTVITFGIYGILWTYLVLDEADKQLVTNVGTKKIICPILSLCFLRNISIAIIYNSIGESQQ